MKIVGKRKKNLRCRIIKKLEHLRNFNGQKGNYSK